MTAAIDLRAQLAQRFPDAIPLPGRQEPGVSTGIALLDQILPNGGLPQGRTTLWSAPAAGATAMLTAACSHLRQQGQRTAWIDGSRALGPGWADAALVFRPRTPQLALRFAELLLMSGGFAMVVAQGVPVDRTTVFRLTGAAHQGQSAFALIAEGGLPGALRLSSRYLPDRFEYARSPFGDAAALRRVAIEVEARAAGWNRRTTLSLAFDSHDVRSALDPGLADRRGGE